MHRLADDAAHRQRLGEMRVVAQILHRVDERELESGQVAVVVEHLAHDHLEDARVHGAGRDDLVHLAQRDARLRRGRAGLGRRRRDRLRDEVVDELDHEAVTGRSGVNDVLAERLQHGPERLERRLVGADHDVEPPLLGLDRRSGERRIDEADAGERERFAHLRRRGRLARRRVDDDEPDPRGGGDAVLAMDDLLDLRRARDAEDDDVRRPRHVRVGRDLLRACGEQVRERRAIAMRAHRQRKALRDEVLRDPVTHETEADEADARLRARRCIHVRPPRKKEWPDPRSHPQVRPPDRILNRPGTISRRRWAPASRPARSAARATRAAGRSLR